MADYASEGKQEPFLAGLLPSEFFYYLGLYLQTCVYLEVAVCKLVCGLERLSPETGAGHVRFQRLRKEPISVLIPTLKTAVQKRKHSSLQETLELIQWIENNKINRHIASHGAFMPTDHAKKFCVQYTHLQGGRKDGKPVEETAEISLADMAEFASNADSGLRAIIRLIDLIEHDNKRSN